MKSNVPSVTFVAFKQARNGTAASGSRTKDTLAFSFRVGMVILFAIFIFFQHVAASRLQGQHEGRRKRLLALDDGNGYVATNCSSGVELVKALANPQVNRANLLTDIVMREEDWSHVMTPIAFQRNFSIVGMQDWAVNLDLSFVRDKILLRNGTRLTLSRLVLINYRTWSAIQQPGIDLITTHPGELATLMFHDAGVVYRACVPLPYAIYATGTFKRPAELPGTNEYLLPYYQTDCSNSTSVPLMDRCYPYSTLCIDFGMYGGDLDVNGNRGSNKYLVYSVNTRALCPNILSEECIRKYDPLGCVLWTYSLKQQPPPPHDSSSNRSSGHPMALIVGCTVGGVVALALVLIVVADHTLRRRGGRGLFPRRPTGKDSAGSDAAALGELGAGLQENSSRDDLGSACAFSSAGVECPKGRVSWEPGISSEGPVTNSSFAGHAVKRLGAGAGAAAHSAAAMVNPLMPLRADLAVGVTLSKRTAAASDGRSSRPDDQRLAPVHSDGAADSSGPGSGGAYGGSQSSDPGVDAALSAQTARQGGDLAGAGVDGGDHAVGDNVVTLLQVVLGKGAFGRVYEGRYRGIPVAVKVLFQDFEVWNQNTNMREVQGGEQLAPLHYQEQEDKGDEDEAQEGPKKKPGGKAVEAGGEGDRAFIAGDGLRTWQASAGGITLCTAEYSAADGMFPGGLLLTASQGPTEHWERVPLGADDTYPAVRVFNVALTQLQGAAKRPCEVDANGTPLPQHAAAATTAAFGLSPSGLTQPGTAAGPSQLPSLDMQPNMRGGQDGMAAEHAVAVAACTAATATGTAAVASASRDVAEAIRVSSPTEMAQLTSSDAEAIRGGLGAAGGTAVPEVAPSPAPQLDRIEKTLAQEVEILGRCQHPGVVRLLAACLKPPHMCLVMELMETSLDKIIFKEHNGTGLPLKIVLNVGIQMASALEYLHPTVVHRDIKPANVLINNASSDNPVAKLSDFGLSRLRCTVVATQNPEAGTPAYSAPECYESTEITHHADIYSLGVVLWTMLTGRRPWEGHSTAAIAFKVTILRERLPLTYLRCPKELVKLIQGCFEHDPLRRPAAAEVLKRLHLIRTQAAMNVKCTADPSAVGVERTSSGAFTTSGDVRSLSSALRPAASQSEANAQLNHPAGLPVGGLHPPRPQAATPSA